MHINARRHHDTSNVRISASLTPSSFLHSPPPFFDSIKDLGHAGQTKRPTSVVLVKKGDYEGYTDANDEVKVMVPPS